MVDYISSHIGEFAALAVAFFWTITALAFESASKKIGSIQVNIIRLVIAFIFISVFNFLFRGKFFPSDASAENWIWLSLSGLIGFVFGDYFLFKSYAVIGSRFSMLIMTLVPPMTALFGWFLLGERLSLMGFIGMIIVLIGISLAIFSRNGKGEKLSLKLAPKGVLYALGGAVGQAGGLVLSKYGMEGYDPFASTQIRIIAGISGFAVLITFLGRWTIVRNSLKNVPAMKSLLLGAFFGPFLGVSFSLLSVKHTEAGIASTIMAIVPILIIAPAVWIYRQKITLLEAIGAVISVIGVALFFI
jgi:drug/metabolite transporter (DMT)-like permease